jgi:short-subunit dehydrogenase
MSKNTIAQRWALVTGASAGIGAALARELASRGANLILTARRIDRLEALARELLDGHSIRAECIAADLGTADAPEKLCAEIDRRGLIVDILVNNAGYGVPGHYQAQPWPVHAEFLQVMVTAPCELAHCLLPKMQERGYGRIINVASLAGLIPDRQGTRCMPPRSISDQFSQSLALENAARGVNICALCPGFTYSDSTMSRARV